MPRIPPLAPLVVALMVLGVVVMVGLRETPRPAPATTGSQALTAFSTFRAAEDPERLQRAEDLARAALAIDPEDLLAIETAARVALSRHRYDAALELADRAAALARHRPTPIGLRAEALLGLGRYADAFAAIDAGLERRPDPASYARASSAAELRGDIEAARVLMDLAVDAAATGTSARRDAQLERIGLNLRYGRADRAERGIVELTEENPGDPALMISRGRLALQRGDLGAARAAFLVGVEHLPAADHLASLAEIEHALGADESAARHLARARSALEAAAGRGDYGLEQAALRADWAIPTPSDVAAARAARERRPSVIGDSVLAWVLARSGQCEEAVIFGRRSLRLGYREPLARFRAAFAEACAGRREPARRIAARLVADTPHFSPRWAPAAREIAVGAVPELPVGPKTA